MKKIIFYIYKKCWDIIANPNLSRIALSLRLVHMAMFV